MTKRSMELLVEASKRICEMHGGGEVIQPREGYSGRAMYGATTCGVVCDRVGRLVAAAALAGKLAKDENERDELIEDLINLRTDGMGYDMIAY